MNKRLIIRNGEVRQNTGMRQVLVDKNFNIRPVLMIINTGHRSEQCTVQVSPEEGDYLLRTEWHRDKVDYFVKEFKDGEFKDLPNSNLRLYKEMEWEGIIDDTGTVEIWRNASENIPWMNKFLSPSHNGPSFIAFTGETIIQKVKRERLERFFDRWDIPNPEISAYMTSPKAGLNFVVKVIPEELLNYVPPTLNTDPDSVKNEYWYGVSKNGTILLNNTNKDNKPLIRLFHPRTYILIKIVHGAYESKGHIYGRTIDIYKLN